MSLLIRVFNFTFSLQKHMFELCSGTFLLALLEKVPVWAALNSALSTTKAYRSGHQGMFIIIGILIFRSNGIGNVFPSFFVHTKRNINTSSNIGEVSGNFQKISIFLFLTKVTVALLR